MGKAERLVRDLGFHFRTVKAGCRRLFRALWHGPMTLRFKFSMNGYKEVSSVSNARDYQTALGQHPLPPGSHG